MPITYKVTNNIVAIAKKIAILPQVQKLRLAQAIDIGNLQVLAASKKVPPIVPLDTGALQSTGTATPSQITGPKIIGGSVSYGGPAPGFGEVDYAVIVHDDIGGRHFKRPGSGPKFVETHWNARKEANKAAYRAALGAAAAEVFGR